MKQQPDCIWVFFDLNGDLGRRFGSIGLSLDKPATKICATINTDELSINNGLNVTGADAERAENIARKLLDSLHLPKQLQLNVIEAIPSHSGLGSGTQMALAVGMAINALYDLGLTVKDIAEISARGAPLWSRFRDFCFRRCDCRWWPWR